jgi:excisionase family DNA binding protein
MAKKKLPDLLTVTQAADYLQTSRQAVSQAVKEGRLNTAAKYGRTILISRTDVAAYKKNRRPGGPPSKRSR